MMNDVTQEVEDALSRIEFNIDTESHIIDESIYQLGKGVTELHNRTKLRVQGVSMDTDDGAYEFHIRGHIIEPHDKTLQEDRSGNNSDHDK